MFITTVLPALSLVSMLHNVCNAAPALNNTTGNVTATISVSPVVQQFWSNVSAVRAMEEEYHSDYFVYYLGAHSQDLYAGTKSFDSFRFGAIYLGFEEETPAGRSAGYRIEYEYIRYEDFGWHRELKTRYSLDRFRAMEARSWDRLGFFSAEIRTKFDPEAYIERILQDSSVEAVSALRDGPWTGYAVATCAGFSDAGVDNHMCFVLRKYGVGHVAYDIMDDTIRYVKSTENDVDIKDTANATAISISSETTISDLKSFAAPTGNMVTS